jgi:hypothetical protein
MTAQSKPFGPTLRRNMTAAFMKTVLEVVGSRPILIFLLAAIGAGCVAFILWRLLRD